MPDTSRPDAIPALDAWLSRLDAAERLSVPEYARRILRAFPGTPEAQRALLLALRDELAAARALREDSARLRTALDDAREENERLADAVTAAENRADALRQEAERLRAERRPPAEGSD